MNKQDLQRTKMYGGTVILEFNPNSHVYKVDSKQVFGVSNVVGVLNKPALMYWAINQTVGFYRDALDPGKPYTEVELEGVHAGAKFATRKTSEESMYIGTFVHEWIEKYINAELNGLDKPERPFDKNINKSIDAFLGWVDRAKIEFVASEKKVLSLDRLFAGTLDAEAVVGGGLSVIDFKTSTGIYDEYWLQVAAYTFARKEETEQKYKGGYVVRIDKVTGEFEVGYKDIVELEGDYEAFLSCLNIYRWQMRNKDKLAGNKNGTGRKD